MRFNYDGVHLASGGDDKVLRVWTVMEQGKARLLFGDERGLSKTTGIVYYDAIIIPL
jgi:hypothetical protein